MASDKRPDPRSEEEQPDLLELFVEMRPIDFEPTTTENGRLVSRGRMHVQSRGHDHVLHLTVSEPAEHDKKDHRDQHDDLRAGFILVLPRDDDIPERTERVEPEEPTVAEEDESLTFEIRGLETTDPDAPSYHVVYAVQRTVKPGKVDTWKATIGSPQLGRIRIMAGIGILSSKSKSIKKGVPHTAGPLSATYLYVRSGGPSSCTYRFSGSFRRQP
jgi:hypothetical protein